MNVRHNFSAVSTASGAVVTSARPVVVFCLAAVLWMLMNTHFQNRHGPAAFAHDQWVVISLVSNAAFAFALGLRGKTRPFVFVPLLFTVFPLTFEIMALWGTGLRGVIPPTAAAAGLDWKFVYDCVWISLELACAAAITALAKCGSPFPPPRAAPPAAVCHFEM